MGNTPRLLLPLLAPGQAQKDLFHNEALQLIDIIIAAAVEEPPLNDPPPAPAVGSCYLVGGSPTGDWSGRANQIGCLTQGGWRFAAPREGMIAFVRSDGVTATIRAGAWETGTISGLRVEIGAQQVVGPRGVAIAAPFAGSVADLEARTAIGEILGALRQHGLIESL